MSRHRMLPLSCVTRHNLGKSQHPLHCRTHHSVKRCHELHEVGGLGNWQIIEWSEGNDCGDYSLLDVDAAWLSSQILYIYIHIYIYHTTRHHPWKDCKLARCEVSTLVLLRIHVFWYMTLCRSVSFSPTFQRNVVPPSPVVKHFKSSPWTPWPLKIKVLHSFKSAGNNDPATQCHIPEVVNPQQVTFCRVTLKLIQWLNQIQVLFGIKLYSHTQLSIY